MIRYNAWMKLNGDFFDVHWTFRDQTEYYAKHRIENFDIKYGTVEVKTETHGYSGGNCWGDDARYFHNSMKNPRYGVEFVLNGILSNLGDSIDIKSSEYNTIINSLVQSEEYTDYEYYGNESSGIKYTINLKQIYNYLIEDCGYGDN